LVTVTVAAMIALLMNSRGIAGLMRVKANSQPCSVNGLGMNVICTESGSVLNDVMIIHEKGTNIRSA
jgi:hypothetical protein